MHLNMLNDIKVELFHTFNPLYAVPIVAVVFCAFLVYAFGFKSPAPPPSFENEKKYSKKRKNKEISKQTKSVINGKANGVNTNKGKISEIPKKKESSSTAISEKQSKSVIKGEANSVNTSKGKISEIPKKKESSSTAISEKISKKVKNQSDKKVPQEKRNDSISYEDSNDDGWVQHVSKKGRKNRKKEETTVPETPSKVTQNIRPVELIQNEVSPLVEETKPVPTEKPTIDNSITEIQMQPKDKPNKKMNKKNLPSSSKSEKLPTPVKSDDKDVEKILKTVTKTYSEDIDSHKSKKNPISPNNQNENKLKEVDSIFVAQNDIVMDNGTANTSSGSKSNVAFDELAGLYTETKEKKKKKVRRDH